MIRPERPIDVGLALARDGEDLRGRRHHAEIDDLVIVAGEHDADDVLADVVHVALDGRHQDLAGGLARVAAVGLLRLHVGQQMRHRLLHHARRLDHLRQEHLAGAEQVADDVHAGHQRALDDVQRTLGREPRLLGVGVDEFGDAVDQRMRDALVDRPVAPGQVLRLGLLAAPCRGSARRASSSRSVASARRLSTTSSQASRSSGLDRLVDRELAGVDDAHVHAGLDRVIEEHRVHRLAHRLVAAEREREIGDAARDVDVRQRLGGSRASPR